jgi:hypothetical protein
MHLIAELPLMQPVTPPTNRAARPAFPREAHRLRAFIKVGQWFDRIDPGVHRRIKGLRLVTAYGIAAMLGTMPEISRAVPNASSLSSIAAGFSLWASVSEGQATRIKSSRDLLVLNGAAVLGAAIMIGLAPILTGAGRPGPELALVGGAFPRAPRLAWKKCHLRLEEDRRSFDFGYWNVIYSKKIFRRRNY